ncbi:Swi3-domain-containing protein [Hymenopellis radicata]|nr:Swi3-domain-containing protein [Hymenopellis radicata]
MDLFDDDAIENEAAASPPAIDHEKDRQTVNDVFGDDEELWRDDLNGGTVESAADKFARERRLAEQAHAKDVYVSLTPHEVLPSSSPARPDFTSKKTKGTEGGKTKERRKPVILNEMTLIGPTGFPMLIQDTKGFKPKGKGHEEQDLNRLLSRYQFWTQRMYPKSQFRDTVDRVEKLSRSRLMHSHLSSWRDERLGISKRPPEGTEDQQPPPSEDVVDRPVPSEDAAARNDSDVALYASSSPAAPTRPPSSSGVSTLDDDAEMEEPSRQGADQGDDNPFEEEWAQGNDMTEEDWDNIPDDPITSAPPGPKGKDAQPPDDDEAMWDDLDDSMFLDGE